MERRTDARNQDGTGTVYYARVSPDEAQGLMQEARDFVDIPNPELASETQISVTQLLSVKDGIVRRSTLTHDITDKTVTIKSEILLETEVLYNPNAGV